MSAFQNCKDFDESHNGRSDWYDSSEEAEVECDERLDEELQVVRDRANSSGGHVVSTLFEAYVVETKMEGDREKYRVSRSAKINFVVCEVQDAK